ncbi:hypothetical protein NUSPORA_02653 [Nucleospora cyclopteri]
MIPPTSETTSISKNLPVDRYVIFKNFNYYYEGRIVDVTSDGNKTLYSVISFATFEYFRVTESELITQTSLESKRRYKPSMNCENFTGIRMPSILKNRLRADKDYYSVNYKQYPVTVPINRVLEEFMVFFKLNSPLYEINEMAEVHQAFKELFNTFLPVCLLYDKEQLEVKEDYTLHFGPIHLLRLLYFIQKNNNKFVEDTATLIAVSDYTIYLIDFLNYKYQEYFT